MSIGSLGTAELIVILLIVFCSSAQPGFLRCALRLAAPSGVLGKG
jgi:hypothetical protein